MKLKDYVEINPPVKLNKNFEYPFVEMKNIESFKKTVQSINNRKFTGSGSKFINGDTLLARITPCLQNGKTSRYKGSNESPAWGSTEFIILRGKENFTDNNFVYYLCISDEFRKYAIKNMIGTQGRQRVPNDQIGEFEFEFPNLSTQKSIAHILGTLDDKIEINQKENETLEEIAKTLFKSWFINFDPVKVKNKSTSTELPREVSDLFPDSFKNFQLGEVPEGWVLTKLGEILSFLGSGNRPKGGASISENQIPSIGAENINFLGNYRYSKEKYVPLEFFKKLKEKNLDIRDYDILIYKDGANIGKSTIFGKGFPHKLCTINEHAFVLRTNNHLQKFLYFYLSSSKSQDDLISLNTGTAQPGINQASLKNLDIFIPPKIVLEKFDLIVSPMIDKIFNNCLSNNILSELRDFLLPKLISQELNFVDAKKLVDKVGA